MLSSVNLHHPPNETHQLPLGLYTHTKSLNLKNKKQLMEQLKFKNATRKGVINGKRRSKSQIGLQVGTKTLYQKQQNKRMHTDAQVKRQNEKNQRILKEMSKSRRIKNSSKISEKLVTMNNFFKEDSPMKGNKTKIKDDPVLTKKQLTNNRKYHHRMKTDMDGHPFSIMKITDSHHQFHESALPHKNSPQSKINPEFSNTTKYLKSKNKRKQILSMKELIRSKETIEEAEKMRSSSNLKPNPKQWHFHDCLSLQKIQLYSTNLKLSCESWICLDHLEIKYLRGWNPKESDDFTPLLRLFVVKTVYMLESEGYIKAEELQLRLNTSLLPEQIVSLEKHELGIPTNSILKLKQLLTILLITNYPDILAHAILNIGYILLLIDTRKKERMRQLQKQLNDVSFDSEISLQLDPQIYLTDKKLVHQSYLKAQTYFKNICKELSLNSTVINICHAKYSLKSTVLDIGILFMKCVGHSQFLEALNHKIYNPRIRYQVGWNFWEIRALIWKNQEKIKYGITAIGGKNVRKNECYVVWNQEKRLITVMADCKVNMHMRDTRRVQEWAQKHIPRFNKKYAVNMTFYPTDTTKFWKIK